MELTGPTLKFTLCNDVDILVPRRDDGTDRAKIAMDLELTTLHLLGHDVRLAWTKSFRFLRYVFDGFFGYSLRGVIVLVRRWFSSVHSSTKFGLEVRHLLCGLSTSLEGINLLVLVFSSI